MMLKSYSISLCAFVLTQVYVKILKGLIDQFLLSPPYCSHAHEKGHMIIVGNWYTSDMAHLLVVGGEYLLPLEMEGTWKLDVQLKHSHAKKLASYDMSHRALDSYVR
jgi:hypothetical protein